MSNLQFERNEMEQNDRVIVGVQENEEEQYVASELSFVNEIYLPPIVVACVSSSDRVMSSRDGFDCLEGKEEHSRFLRTYAMYRFHLRHCRALLNSTSIQYICKFCVRLFTSFEQRDRHQSQCSCRLVPNNNVFEMPVHLRGKFPQFSINFAAASYEELSEIIGAFPESEPITMHRYKQLQHKEDRGNAGTTIQEDNQCTMSESEDASRADSDCFSQSGKSNRSYCARTYSEEEVNFNEIVSQSDEFDSQICEEEIEFEDDLDGFIHKSTSHEIHPIVSLADSNNFLGSQNKQQLLVTSQQFDKQSEEVQKELNEDVSKKQSSLILTEETVEEGKQRNCDYQFEDNLQQLNSEPISGINEINKMSDVQQYQEGVSGQMHSQSNPSKKQKSNWRRGSSRENHDKQKKNSAVDGELSGNDSTDILSEGVKNRREEEIRRRIELENLEKKVLCIDLESDENDGVIQEEQREEEDAVEFEDPLVVIRSANNNNNNKSSSSSNYANPIMVLDSDSDEMNGPYNESCCPLIPTKLIQKYDVLIIEIIQTIQITLQDSQIQSAAEAAASMTRPLRNDQLQDILRNKVSFRRIDKDSILNAISVDQQKYSCLGSFDVTDQDAIEYLKVNHVLSNNSQSGILVQGEQGEVGKPFQQQPQQQQQQQPEIREQCLIAPHSMRSLDSFFKGKANCILNRQNSVDSDDELRVFIIVGEHSELFLSKDARDCELVDAASSDCASRQFRVRLYMVEGFSYWNRVKACRKVCLVPRITKEVLEELIMRYGDEEFSQNFGDDDSKSNSGENRLLELECEREESLRRLVKARERLSGLKEKKSASVGQKQSSERQIEDAMKSKQLEYVSHMKTYTTKHEQIRSLLNEIASLKNGLSVEIEGAFLQAKEKTDVMYGEQLSAHASEILELAQENIGEKLAVLEKLQLEHRRLEKDFFENSVIQKRSTQALVRLTQKIEEYSNLKKNKIKLIQVQKGKTSTAYLCVTCKKSPQNCLQKPCGHVVTCYACMAKENAINNTIFCRICSIEIIKFIEIKYYLN